MIEANVAEGVHRIEDAYTNWYLIEDGGRLTVVDAGVPTSWDSLQKALDELGHSATDIDAALLIMVSLLRNRAFWPAPIADVCVYRDGALDVPGSPRVIFSPGHTYGHCALHLPDRDVLLAGDAIVTLDPYTGRRGPQIVARAATAYAARAMESLDALEATSARTVLTGHGDPWHDGIAEACRRAREIGIH